MPLKKPTNHFDAGQCSRTENNRKRIKDTLSRRYGGLTMPDLFDDVPVTASFDSNYATQKALQWIESDPGLAETCRTLARQWRRTHRGRSLPNRRELEVLPLSSLATDLCSVVLREAVRVEHAGLFFELFLNGVREILWTDLAEYFLATSRKNE